MADSATSRVALQKKSWDEYLNVRMRWMARIYRFYSKILAEKSNLDKIDLPTYNPDAKQSDIELWCKQVDDLISKEGHTQQTAFMKAVTCLKGRAKKWACNNAFKYNNWDTFQDALINRFTTNRYIDIFMNHGHISSDYAISYDVYVMERWRFFADALPNAPDDFIMAAVVIGIKPEIYQEIIINAKPKTLEDLREIVKGFKKRTA